MAQLMQRGFTLLELMVVLVLVGIVLSFATLSIGDGGHERYMEEETQRLVTLMKMAREEAILRSEDWAIVFKEDGYKFERQEPKITKGKVELDRTPIENKIFRERELHELKLSLFVEDTQINLDKEDEEEGAIARIYIMSSGDMTEFELKLQSEHSPDYFTVKGTVFGELSIEETDKE